MDACKRWRRRTSIITTGTRTEGFASGPRTLISYRRGQIQILDHARLRTVACECYETVRELFQNFYG